MYVPPSILEERLKRTRKAVRQTPDHLDKLLLLLDDLPIEHKEDFEIEIKVFLRTLQDHYKVWNTVLAESEKRKVPTYGVSSNSMNTTL
ncbi:hypothetical protein L1N85_19765 [Paenibacillus alkaliterrae]|uniref:hypothetical protein n=1 Tax=Paenibacillus alkaliterrae TaxID=320909 RepID=UPI001F23D8DC|nr:hypothetical protein [Paenibacillus alkaliterrae]MCF2940634.1 hypothetical protein [Paenibacillus alkaliterrae]